MEGRLLRLAHFKARFLFLIHYNLLNYLMLTENI